MEHPTLQGKGADSESFLHSPPPQHTACPPILRPPILGWDSDRLGGIVKGHIISLAGRDQKRSSHLSGWEGSQEVISSACPGRDADDASGRCLSNQFLHHIPRLFVPQHLQSSAGVPLLLPLSSANVETRLSIFFFSWCLNEDLCSLPLHKNLNNLKTFHFPKDFSLWLLLSQPSG